MDDNNGIENQKALDQNQDQEDNITADEIAVLVADYTESAIDFQQDEG